MIFVKYIYLELVHPHLLRFKGIQLTLCHFKPVPLTFDDATASVTPSLYPAGVTTLVTTVRQSLAFSPRAPKKAGIDADRSSHSDVWHCGDCVAMLLCQLKSSNLLGRRQTFCMISRSLSREQFVRDRCAVHQFMAVSFNTCYFRHSPSVMRSSQF